MEKPAPPYLLLFAVLVPGGLMALLSTTVTGIALPDMLATLGSDVATGQWVTTAYMLAAGLAITVSGWASTRFGLRTIWLAAMAMFAVGAVASFLAPDIGSLIAARAVQGFGGGALEPLMVTALAAATPPARMGRTMGAMGIVMEIGPLMGPTLGGWAVGSFGWRSIYLGFAVAAALMMIGGSFVLRNAGRRAVPFDGVGLLLVSAGIVAGLWALSRAAQPAGVDPAVAAALVASVAMFAVFGIRGRRRGGRSIVDLGVFARGGFTPAMVIMTLLGAAIFPLFFGLPQFYQGVLHLSPVAAGVLMVPYGVGTLTAMPLMGRLSDRVEARRLAGGGALLALVAFAALFVGGDVLPPVALAFLSLLTGLGLGSIASPTVATMYRVLPEAMISSGSTILFTVLQFGGALGVAVLVLLIGRESWTAAAGTWPFLVPVVATAAVLAASRGLSPLRSA